MKFAKLMNYYRKEWGLSFRNAYLSTKIVMRGREDD